MVNAFLSFGTCIVSMLDKFFTFFIHSSLIETAIGAFFGAWAAFQFEKSETKKQIMNRQNSALIQAQFILMAELRQVIMAKENYSKKVKEFESNIKSVEKNEEFFQYRALTVDIYFTLELIKINIDELMFLLKKEKGGYALLSKILSSKSGYNQFLSEIERQNKLKFEIESIRSNSTQLSDLKEIIKLIGIDKVTYLTIFTNKILELPDGLIRSYCDALDCLILFINKAKEFVYKSLPVDMDEKYEGYFPRNHNIWGEIVWNKEKHDQ